MQPLFKLMNKICLTFFLGVPSLDLMSFDPLIIPHLDINQGSAHGAIDIKLNFRDLHIHNIGSIKITSIK